MCVLSHSVVSDSFSTPWKVACQVPLTMGFSRQEYESGLLFPPPGDHPNPGIEPESPVCPAMAGGLFTTDLTGKPIMEYYSTLKRRKLFHLK